MGTEDAGHCIHQHLLPIQHGPLEVGGRDGAVAMRTRDRAVAMHHRKPSLTLGVRSNVARGRVHNLQCTECSRYPMHFCPLESHVWASDFWQTFSRRKSQDFLQVTVEQIQQLLLLLTARLILSNSLMHRVARSGRSR